MLRRGTLPILVAVLSQFALVVPATADDGDPDDGDHPGLDFAGHYIKGGVNVGLSFHGDEADGERGDGVVYAGEVGYTYIHSDPWWLGGTLEVGRDTAGDNSTRFAIGPKAGVLVVGLDLRYLGERNNGQTEHGFNIRVRGTVAFAGGYLGFSRVGDDFFVEVGGQLKAGPRLVDTD